MPEILVVPSLAPASLTLTFIILFKPAKFVFPVIKTSFESEAASFITLISFTSLSSVESYLKILAITKILLASVLLADTRDALSGFASLKNPGQSSILSGITLLKDMLA